MDRRHASPVGEGPPRLGEQRAEGGAIPGAHHRIDHDLGAPGGDEHISVAVIPATLDARRRDEALVGRLAAVGAHAGHLGTQQQRVAQGRNARDARRSTVPLASLPACGAEKLAERRQVDCPDDRQALAFEADQNAIQRHAIDECLGAIDRIENPAMRRAGIGLTLFLAQNAVVRIACGDQLAHQALGLAVRDGHRRIVGLGIRHDAGLEVAQGDAPGQPGELAGKCPQGVEGLGSHHSSVRSSRSAASTRSFCSGVPIVMRM